MKVKRKIIDSVTVAVNNFSFIGFYPSKKIAILLLLKIMKKFAIMDIVYQVGSHLFKADSEDKKMDKTKEIDIIKGLVLFFVAKIKIQIRPNLVKSNPIVLIKIVLLGLDHIQLTLPDSSKYPEKIYSNI